MGECCYWRNKQSYHHLSLRAVDKSKYSSRKPRYIQGDGGRTIAVTVSGCLYSATPSINNLHLNPSFPQITPWGNVLD